MLPVSRWHCTRFRRVTKDLDAIDLRVDDIDLKEAHLCCSITWGHVNVVQSQPAMVGYEFACRRSARPDSRRCQNDALARGHDLLEAFIERFL